MQNVSFNIGNEQKRDLKNASTTYKHTISDQSNEFKHYLQNRSHTSVGAKVTSLNLSQGQKIDYVSE